MDILAGFDLAIEIDRLTLFNLVRSHPLMEPFRTPFELTVAGTSDEGTAHFVFVDSDVFVGAANVVELRLSFAHSSIIANASVRRHLGADLTSQRGTISIGVPISIERGAEPAARDLVLDLIRATPIVRFVRPAGDLAGADAIAHEQSAIEFTIRTALQARIRALAGVSMPGAGNPRIPLALRIDPTAPVSLSPLVGREIQLKTIATDAPELQSLVLFIMLGGSVHGRPDDRTESGLPAGTNLALTLSPWVFRQFIMVPAVLGTLQVAHSELLPASYGRSESVPFPPLPEWSITHVEGSLRRDAVGLFIHARYVRGDEPFQSATNGDIRGHLSMTVDDGGGIVPSWTTDSAESWTSWGPGWWFIGAFGPFFLMQFIDIVVVFAGRSIGDSLRPPFRPIAAPLSFPGARLRAIDIDHDHFGIAGVMSPRPAPGASFTTTMAAATMITDRVVDVDSEPYHSRFCPEGDYSYTSFHQIHRVTFTAQPRFGSHPIRYAWQIAGNDPVMAGTSDNLHLRVTSYRPDPPPGDPPAAAEVDMQIEVSADGTQLTLRAGPEDGNFNVGVVCTATDADGRTSRNYDYALFMTRGVVFGGTWEQDFADCMRRHARELYELAGIDWDFPHAIPPGKSWPPEPGKIAPSDVLPALLLGQRSADKDSAAATRHATMMFGPVLETGLQLPSTISPEAAMQVLLTVSKMLSNPKEQK